LPVLGFRVGNLAYCTDVSFIPEPSFELLKNLDVLVLDALQHKKHTTHFSLEQAMEAAGGSARSRRSSRTSPMAWPTRKRTAAAGEHATGVRWASREGVAVKYYEPEHTEGYERIRAEGKSAWGQLHGEATFEDSEIRACWRKSAASCTSDVAAPDGAGIRLRHRPGACLLARARHARRAASINPPSRSKSPDARRRSAGYDRLP
jgi:hypothetical protein